MTEEPNLLQPQASGKDTMLKKAFEETAPGVISTTEKQDSNDDDARYDESDDLIKLGPLTIIWPNVILYLSLNIGSVYGVYLALVHAKWQSLLLTFLMTVIPGLSITAGAHRLWTHRSYKAKLPLRIFLAITNTLAWQRSLYSWIRDHRVHHKYGETNADIANVKRGFFYAHFGWLTVRKQKVLIEKGNTFDFSDVWADPVIRIQRRLFAPMSTVFFILQFVVPYYYWSEHWTVCVFVVIFLRITLIVHSNGFINSVAHLYGMKPYDRNISAGDQNWVAFVTLGEGFHNYHHAFPRDYTASGLGYKYNLTTFFIDCMAYIGQAYDLKKTSPKIVHQYQVQRGDGSYFNERERNEWAHYNKSN